jgi:ABC-2 type transport system ATP-binding protein
VVIVNDTRISAGAAVMLAGLRKSYGDVHAVAGVDLTIAPGEVVALLGPNGAGKSTTVDMLLGLTRPDAGTVTVFGVSPHEAVTTGTIGAMLQGGALLDDATVGETVAMVASLHRSPMPVADALRRSGVEDLANRRCNKLSGGQKQRVRFAVALVSDPDLLVLDEPTAAMDAETEAQIFEHFRSLTHDRIAILISHRFSTVRYADQIVVLDEGSIVEHGSHDELMARQGRYAHLFNLQARAYR